MSEWKDAIVDGGSLPASFLTLVSTWGAGTSDYIVFKTGSQTEAMRIDTNQLVTIAKWLQWSGQKRIASDVTVTNTTTLADMTGLSVNVAAGGTYVFEAVLLVKSGASAGGVRAAISGTATATDIRYDGYCKDTGGTGTHGYAQAAALAGVVANATPTSDTTTILIHGTITVNAAGTLKVQAAQSAANVTGTVFARGSYFIVHNVA